MPRRPEYRSLTRKAAARVAKEFDVTEHAEVIFTTVSRAIDAHARFRNRPDYWRVRNALEELVKPLRQARLVATKYQTTFAQALFDTLLRRLGELFTYEAIESLSGKYVPRRPRFREDDFEDFEAKARLDRSVAAALAGAKLLVPFFQEMLKAVEDSLKRLGPPARGRRLKQLLRLYLIMELAKLYEWLFDRRPTSTTRGDFTKFCESILHEMRFDMAGVEHAIADALKSEGYLKR